MVGLGTQDDLAYAKNFASGITFAMLWSKSFASWSHFGVTSQPKIVLLDGSGNIVGGGPGRFHAGRIEEQLAGLA